MAKDKPIAVGDVVYSIVEAEKKPGVVISVEIIEVDWGPETGVSDHHAHTLTKTFVPDYGAKS